jgi:ketosteroid isomerase-like protein
VGAGALAAALARGAAPGAAALYSDDGRLLAPAAGIVCGRDQIEAYWRAGIGLGLFRLELEAREVEVIDGLAIEVGRYAIAVASGADAGEYLVLHRRQADGTWRRAVDVFNPDEPSARSPRAQDARPPRPEAR